MTITHQQRRWRRRAKRMLKLLPRRANLRRYPGLRHVAHWAAPRPELWSYKAPFTTRAIYIGSIITLLPLMGVQIPVAFLFCVLLRANLPIAAALQFVSNPLTAPLYVGTYYVGEWVMGLFGLHPVGWLSGASLYLAIGGVLCGLALAVAIHLTVVLVGSFHPKSIPLVSQASP